MLCSKCKGPCAPHIDIVEGPPPERKLHKIPQEYPTYFFQKMEDTFYIFCSATCCSAFQLEHRLKYKEDIYTEMDTIVREKFKKFKYDSFPGNTI